MRRSLIKVRTILLVFVLAACDGQVLQEDDTGLEATSDTLSVIPEIEMSLCYLGDGRFMELRSCRMPWLAVDIDSVSFSNSDSLFTIVGTVFDEMNHGDIFDIPLQVIVGSLDTTTEIPFGESTVISGATMDIRERYILEDGEKVRLSIGLDSGSVLCITPAESDDGIIMVGAYVLRLDKLLNPGENGS